ncbi:auxin efflux carrier [Syncephalastrum racemosum]|uniref:Auxin efflux carrier n=1 Tax=Syncephalastrum racemosum TaxID=13706 RepID=A0A1X2HL72_SYNRA|nr:auxin efflux carrier [Syncephalastrum racemosum]
MVVVFFGFCLTKAGYITTDKQKWLSRLNMVFFTPCLLFTNIASVMSLKQLIDYWPIPCFYIIFFILSFTTAQLVARMTGLTREFRRFVLACVMFSNTNSLPIAVISSLAVSEAGKVLYWGADDTQQSVAARGISYALFYAIFGNLVRWSYGYSLLQPKDESTVVVDYSPQVRHLGQQTATTAQDYGTATAATKSPSSGASSTHSSDILLDVERDGGMARRTSSVTLAGDHPTKHQQKQPAATVTPPNEATGLLSSFPSLPSDLDDQDNTSDDTTLWQRIKARIPESVISWVTWANNFMTPPLYAAILALFVGLIPPFKHVLFAQDSFLYPSFTSAIQSCGRAAVPIILVCLGAQLTDILHSDRDHHGQGAKPVAVAITVRMILVPLMVIPTVLLFVTYGSSWAGIATDPVFGVMMIILGCTPTAINLVQISQVTGAFEEEMLRVLFWSYGVVCVPVFTVVVFAALSIVDKFIF